MDDDRLKGWKEISDFLHVRQRTTQRWEHTLGLPVHRIETAKSAIVFASRREVDAWLETAEAKRARSEEPTAESAIPDGHGAASVEEVAPLADLADLLPPTSAPRELPITTEPGDAASPTLPAVSAVDVALAEPPQVIGSRRPAHLRSWFLASGLGAAVVLVSVLFYAHLLPMPHGKVSRLPARVPANAPGKSSTILPAGRAARRSLALRLTLADGRTFRISVTTGVLATIALAGRPPYALSAEPTEDGVRVHLYRIEATTLDGNKQLAELTVISLKPGDKKQLREPTDIAAIEWAVKSVSRLPRP
jgi:hypothetical protein